MTMAQANLKISVETNPEGVSSPLQTCLEAVILLVPRNSSIWGMGDHPTMVALGLLLGGMKMGSKDPKIRKPKLAIHLTKLCI